MADALLSELSVSNTLEDRSDIVNTRVSLQDKLLDYRKKNRPKRHVKLSWG